MSEISPSNQPQKNTPWAMIGAVAFLVISLVILGLSITDTDLTAMLFPTPTERPVLIQPTVIPPTPAPTATPDFAAANQGRARIALIPPDGDTSDLSEQLPEVIRASLIGSVLGQYVEFAAQPSPDDALAIAWEPRDDGLVNMTIHSRFEPVPASLDSALVPYNIVGPETTPLIVDPSADPQLAGGLAAALLELEMAPTQDTLARIRALQAISSTLNLAEETWNQAIVLFAAAQAEAALGDPSAALETYSQVLRMQPDFPAAVINRGSVYLALGDSDAALAIYEPYRDVDAYRELMAYNQAIATLSGDDQTAALESAEELVKEDPESAWRVNLRGYIRARSGDSQAALDDFQRADDLAPGTPVLLLNQAAMLMALHRFDEALAVYGTLTVIEPRNALYRYRQALAYEAAGNTPSALDALSQAIVLDGRFIDAYLERARLEIAAGDFDKAQADADQVLALDQENGPAYAVIGACLLAQEEWVEAEEAYDNAADLGVSTVDLFEGRAWAHHRQEELRSAIADYNEAINLGANNPELLFRLGFASIDMNQRKEALNALLGAINGGLDTAEAHAALALALDLNNRNDEAELEYERAISLDDRFQDRDFLLDQPLWSTLSINRAMAIVRRLEN